MPAPREDRAGRFTCHSRSTAFGVMPATDSSEMAVTSPSFVSAVQVAGTSKAKQVPVRVDSRRLGSRGFFQRGLVLPPKQDQLFLGFLGECLEFSHEVGVVSRDPGFQGPSVPGGGEESGKPDQETRKPDRH